MENNADKIIHVDIKTEAMDHSDGCNWDWFDSRDFIGYLIENEYISKCAVAAIPHDGSHKGCNICQSEKIIIKLKQFRKTQILNII